MSRDSRVVQHPLEWISGAEAPETPVHLNRIGIRRYERALLARAAGRSETILLLMPGFTGGVNDFDTFATALVAATPGLEVWALERRNHLLEDLRGMEAAEAAGDPTIALQYYLDGGGPPLLVPADVSWMRQWGLAVALADLRAAVRSARAAVGASGRVLLGGHSLGGMLAQCYAAWDFEGSPGHAEVDGLVLLDGAVGGPEWTATTGATQYAQGFAAVTVGEVFWDQPARGASPGIAVLAQVAALAATLPEWREQPSLVLPRLATLSAGDAAPGWAHLRLPEGALLTNEAVFGYLLDAETGPFPSYRAHVGALNPEPIGVAEGMPLLGWRSHIECGKPTDLAAVAAALCQIDGTNGMEWYAARRLNVEVDLSSNLDSQDPLTRSRAQSFGLRLWHNAAMPLPVFGAVTRSEEQNRSRYAWYRDGVASEDVTLREFPQYDHLDLLFASPEGGNPCVTAVAEWIAAHRGG
jgi:pimeloyl-ACP methyl ester carboxylesterase